MLAELMRMQKTVAVAGTHGKTTTTSMIAALLDAGGIDPTVINGGIINRYGSNARLGKSDWWVIEADESDGSFLRLDGTIAVVTNIDPEHLEHYGSFDAVKDAFVEFIENVPFYGLAVMCVDHPEVQNFLSRIRDRRIVTYGFSALADVRADNVDARCRGAPASTCWCSSKRRRAADDRRRARPDARAATMSRMRWPRSRSRSRWASTTRRSSAGSRSSKGSSAASPGSVRSTARSIIDDYAHHPTEINAVLCGRAGSAREEPVIAVVQPHRFTRLRDLMEDFQNAFNDADVVFVTPVYPAGEEPIEGVDAAALVDGLRAHGHRMARTVADLDEVCAALRDLAAEGDMIICMGAGDITKWAAGLADGICAKRESTVSRVSIPLPKREG